MGREVRSTNRPIKGFIKSHLLGLMFILSHIIWGLYKKLINRKKENSKNFWLFFIFQYNALVSEGRELFNGFPSINSFALVAQLEEHQAADLGLSWVRVLPGAPDFCSGGGIGIHVRLRFVCRKMCGFKSHPEHHKDEKNYSESCFFFDDRKKLCILIYTGFILKCQILGLTVK